MRDVLISLLLLTFLVGCQTKSKVIVKEEPKEAEEMETELEKVWQGFLSAMQSGNEEEIKSFVTERGFESLGERIEPSERKNRFRIYGEGWSRWDIKWIEVSDEKAMAIVGAEFKKHGFEFIRTKDGWKLDRFMPGA